VINPNILKDESQEILASICAMIVPLPTESTGYESSFGSRVSWLRICPEKGSHVDLITNEVFQCGHVSRSEIAQIHMKFASSDEEKFNIWSQSHVPGMETWESGMVLSIFLLSLPV
jgi:hypothetical protein